MKVVFLEDVEGVAQGGDVKEVANGFARNYLIPKRLALLASPDALQRVQRLKRQAGSTRLKRLEDITAIGEAMDGVQVNVEMRAGASGRLYGSVTNAIVAAELSKMTERAIDRRTVELAEPIREVGRHAVRVRLHAEVSANVTVLVHPSDTDPAEFLEALLKAEAEEEERAKAEAVADAEEATEEASGAVEIPEIAEGEDDSEKAKE